MMQKCKTTGTRSFGAMELNFNGFLTLLHLMRSAEGLSLAIAMWHTDFVILRGDSAWRTRFFFISQTCCEIENWKITGVQNYHRKCEIIAIKFCPACRISVWEFPNKSKSHDGYFKNLNCTHWNITLRYNKMHFSLCLLEFQSYWWDFPPFCGMPKLPVVETRVMPWVPLKGNFPWLKYWSWVSKVSIETFLLGSKMANSTAQRHNSDVKLI